MNAANSPSSSKPLNKRQWNIVVVAKGMEGITHFYIETRRVLQRESMQHEPQRRVALSAVPYSLCALGAVTGEDD
jgi:hypothetical protein